MTLNELNQFCVNRGAPLGGDRNQWIVDTIERQAADIGLLRVALSDLLSWFPEKPSEPEWRLKAGTWGADDAVSAARNLVAVVTQEDAS